MPAVRRPRLLRSVVAAAAAAVVSPLLVPIAVASAGDDVTAGDTVVGELVRVWAEPEHQDHAAEGIHAEPLTWIEPDSGEPVRVLTDEVAAVPVGATVEVTVGEELTDVASAEEGIQPARDVLNAEVVEPAPASSEDITTAPAATALTNEVTVAMVVPAGGVQDGTTLAQVVDAVNGPVARFWANESQGAISVGVTAAHDWSATVAPGLSTTTASCAEYLALWKEVADRVGFTAGPGKHLMLYVTSAPSTLSGCSYGLAQVGSAPSSGGRLYVRATATSLIAHEFGHNFGLGHASQLQCDASVHTGTCRVTEYYDAYDVMGFSWEQIGSLNTPHAARLGFLPAGTAPTVTAGATTTEHTLTPLGARAGTRAIRLADSDGDAYWLEYRSPTGQDGWLGTSADRIGLQPGVLLRLAGSGNSTSLMLDGTPSSAAQWDDDLAVAIPVGSTISVGDAPFTVTVLEATTSGARVEVAASPATSSLTTSASTMPVGSWDGLSASGSTVSLSGWTFDPDHGAAPVAVHVYVDGRWGRALTADVSRPDVGRAFPAAGPDHGFSGQLEVAPGVRTVCAYAIDVDGRGNTGLGCRSIRVG